MYVEVTVIVDGAVTDRELFYDSILLTAFVDDVERDCESAGFSAEVFTIYHDHAPSEECECVQYLTDHKPAYVFGKVDA